MVRKFLIILMIFALAACVKDNDCPCQAGQYVVEFDMKDVAYIFEGDEAVAYRPYYFLTNRLDIWAFKNQLPDTSFNFDYEYCRDHLQIPVDLNSGGYDFLLIGNLMDRRAVSWDFTEQGLQAHFKILDHQEPPVFLAATNRLDLYMPATVQASLKMLVARLEVKIVNPPSWVNGFDFNVRQIAGEINNLFQLGDTTSIYKNISVDSTRRPEFWVGITTFPTYKNTPARVDVKALGINRESLFVIEDNRLNFTSGTITRVSIEYESDNKLNISVEVNGKWEIIDEGRIEI